MLWHPLPIGVKDFAVVQHVRAVLACKQLSNSWKSFLLLKLTVMFWYSGLSKYCASLTSGPCFLEGLAILHKYTIEEIVGFLQEVHTDFPLNPHLCDLQYQSETELHLYLPIVFFIQQFFHSRSCVGIICGSRSKCVSGNLWQADKASAL